MQCNQFHSKFRSVSDLAILTGIFYEVSASPLLPRLTFKLRFFPLWETKELCIASPHCQNLPPPTPNTPKDEFYELLIFSPQRTIPKLERNFRGFHINFLISFFRKWNYSRFTRRAEFPPPFNFWPPHSPTRSISWPEKKHPLRSLLLCELFAKKWCFATPGFERLLRSFFYLSSKLSCFNSFPERALSNFCCCFAYSFFDSSRTWFFGWLFGPGSLTLVLWAEFFRPVLWPPLQIGLVWGV